MRYAAMTSDEASRCATRMKMEAVDTARMPMNSTSMGEAAVFWESFFTGNLTLMTFLLDKACRAEYNFNGLAGKHVFHSTAAVASSRVPAIDVSLAGNFQDWL